MDDRTLSVINRKKRQTLLRGIENRKLWRDMTTHFLKGQDIEKKYFSVFFLFLPSCRLLTVFF